jgi:hypothetical protein
MKIVISALIIHFCVAAVIAQTTPATPTVSLSGTMRTDMLAPGGETTGYNLIYKNAQGNTETLQVRITSNTVGSEKAKNNASVTVTGMMSTIDYPTLGTVPCLLAESIKAN